MQEMLQLSIVVSNMMLNLDIRQASPFSRICLDIVKDKWGKRDQ
jgi:hypothetical protein